MESLVQLILIWTDRAASTGRDVSSRLGAHVRGVLDANPQMRSTRASAFTDRVERSRYEADVVKYHLRRGAQAYLAIVGGLFGDGQGILDFIGKDLDTALHVEFFSWLDFHSLLIPFVKTRTVTLAARMLFQEEDGSSAMESVSKKIIGCLADYPPLREDPDVLRLLRAVGRYGACLGLGKLQEKCRSLQAPRHLSETRWEKWLVSAQNVSYVKRAMPPMPPYEVEAATLQHRKVLSEVHPLPGEPPVRDMIQERIRLWIDVICDHIFGRSRFEPKEVVPSVNACFERSAVDGGALVELLGNAWEDVDQLHPGSVHLADVHGSDFDRMVEVGPGDVREIRSSRAVQQALDRFTDSVNRRVSRARLPRGSCPFCVGELNYDEYCLHVDVLPAAVCEPCKVRMITMGTATVYQRALVLQKFLWGRLKEDPHFQWTGKPITESDWADAYPIDYLLEYFGREPGAHFVSGDFKASTDNLDPALSLYSWERICKCASVLKAQPIPVREPGEPFPTLVQILLRRGVYRDVLTPLAETEWMEIGRACLVGHVLHHGDKRSEAKPLLGGLQRWGQLMGSPISFPILNIVNAACACAALGPLPPLGISSRPGSEDPEMKRWRARANVYWLGNPHLIHTNGDDVAFLSPSNRATNRWCEVTAIAGLEASAGKNFRSSEFVQINSEMRTLVRAHGPSLENRADPLVWRYVPFLNLPLLFGCGVKGPKAGRDILEEVPCFSVGPIARQLVRGCDVPLARTRLLQWRTFYRRLLDRVPSGVIWEAPEALGGLGVPPFSGRDPPSDALKRCAWLACLDTISRLKAVTPPGPEPLAPWLKALGRAMNAGLTVSRAVVAPPDQKDFRPAWGDPVGGRGSTLGEFLRSWVPNDLERTALGLIGRDPTPGARAKASKALPWIQVLKQDRIDVVVCAARERRWRQQLSQQWKLVHQACVREPVECVPMSEFLVGARDIRDSEGFIVSYKPEAHRQRVPLRPMKPSKLASWKDTRVLVEAVLAPNYDTRLQRL